MFSHFDFAAIEERVIMRERVDAALALPRNHPMRFALLYGCGPATIRRYCETVIANNAVEPQPPITFKILQEMHREMDILCFENWQANATADLLEQHRRENAAIAYAAVEQGIVSPETDVHGTTTGRITAGWEPDDERDRRG